MLLVTIIGLPSREYRPVVVAAIVAAALISYVPIRHWERVSATVARHPAYLAVEILISAFVLAAGGVRGPFFYFTLGTAALAGVIYGRRGAIPFSALLISVYELVLVEGLPSVHPHVDAQVVLFAPLLYPVAVLAGITARDMVERGARAEGLLHQRTVALGAERERLRVARELHDSLAKTVEGLAMSASVLPSRCQRDPDAAASLARELAADARRAALEARMLMTDLRPGAAVGSLQDALRARVQTFAERAGVEVELMDESRSSDGRLSQQDIHELLRIVGEAMTNAVTHGHATRLEVALDNNLNGELIVNVIDNGGGLAEAVDVEALTAAGHFGIAGMHERARSIGATLLIEPGEDGASVSVRLPPPGAEQSGAGPAPRASGRRWSIRRRRGALEPRPATKEAS